MKKKNTVFLTLAGSFFAGAQVPQPMNVLFIMSDDLNTDLGCYGHPLVKTPYLDRLAQQGMMFTHAYCQFPLSGPSRASMLTGLRPEKTNMCINETNFREALPDVITLPQLFMKHGYVTGRAGKIFHYGVPSEIGTDGHDDTISWNIRVNPKGRDKYEENKLINYTPSASLGIAPAWLAAEGTDEEQTDGMVATEVIKMMAQNKDKPFFIAAGFFRPHCPYIAPKKYFDLYPLDSIRLPQTPPDDLNDVPELAQHKALHTKLTPEQQKYIHRAYYASISFMDAQVGRLLNALDSLGLSKKTIVVFMGDNGYMLGEHFLWTKFLLFEKSVRVPLIIYHPGLACQSHATDEIVELLDVYPTLAFWCGLTSTHRLDGDNLHCFFENHPEKWQKKSAVSVVSRPNPPVDNTKPNWGYTYRGKSIRTSRWRYTEWDQGASGTELYDHASDPGEFTNLRGRKEFKKTIEKLKKEFR